MTQNPQHEESGRPAISIVVPVLNEEENILPLHGRLVEVLDTCGKPYEIIFVDDGSRDETYLLIQQLSRKYKNLTGIRLRKNFGKAEAISAGFQYARGGIIITCDGDLQDDPGEIPRFLEKIDEGFDLVSGWKQKRKDPLRRRAASKIFNRITGWISGISLHDFNCGFKAYRRDVAQSLQLYGELHRYVPVLAHAQGFRICELKIKHHPRKFGKSKYGAERYFRGFFDLLTVVLLTKYFRRPLHFFGSVGLLFAAVGFGINLYLTVLRLSGEGISNRPLLLLGVLLIVMGAQIFSIGLLGELITHITARYKKRDSIRETTDRKQED
jgi:glycosyltransferase involved in cell wall biosynthesis